MEGRPPPAPDDRASPLVLYREGSRGPMIHDADPNAEACGLRPGGRLTDALVVAPDTVAVEAVPVADRTALDRAAAWCRRWSPHVRAIGGAWGDAALALDTTGCDHLHGGEAALLRDMRARWNGLGYGLRAALAPTLGAALALARHGEDGTIAQPHDLAERLAPLPVEALRLDPETALVLRRLGLKRIGDLEAVPRKALARRFSRRARKSDRDATWDDIFERGGSGANDKPGSAGKPRPADPLGQLDRALGRVREPLMPVPDVAPIVARVGLMEPTDRADALRALLDGLIERVCGELVRRGEGARSVELLACRTDGGSVRLAVRAAAPTRDAEHIARLFAERVETLDAGFGFDALVLEATEAEVLDARQVDGRQIGAEGAGAGEGAVDLAAALARTIDALSGRLGADRVRVAIPMASHWPERAEAWVPAMGRIKELVTAAGGEGPVLWTEAGPPGRSPPVAPRPERLLDPPEAIEVLYGLPDGPPVRFRWRRVSYRVVRRAGPERIAPEWWRERSTARARDYWRVEDEGGRRFWLFREGLHEDGRGPVAWFCHGLFS